MKLHVVISILIIVCAPSFASTHKDIYPLPCGTLWNAVKDTVLHSGEYVTVFLDPTEMIASFAQGVGNTFHINSAVLNREGDGCEMQVQTNSVAFHDDAGNFKKRVEASLGKPTAGQSTKNTDRGSQ